MATDQTSDDTDARLAALAQLLAGSDPPTPHDLDELRRALGDARKRVQRRAAETCAALAGRGWPIRELLERALMAPALRVRWGAAYALSLLGPLPAAAQATLLELLGDADGDLRWAAADLLKRLAERERSAVISALVASARALPSRRKMALYCLRDLGAADALDIAHTALADDRFETRLAALAYVARLDPDRGAAARCIAALVDDADPRVQRAAAGTLAGLGLREPWIIAILRRAAASHDPSLCRAAQHALRQLGSAG